MVELEHEIGKVYDAPRPCPKCGHGKAEFLTTATDYGAWWKCVKCGEHFGTREWLIASDAAVSFEPIIQPQEETESHRKAELEWYKTYGRDKCKYGEQCVHCCPYCCIIFEYDENYLIKGVKGIRFEPKREKGV